MSLRFCSFASGSSGNCYLVKNDRGAILIDAGISGKRIMQGLDETETSPEDVSAVLVTHEHTDHTKSLSVLTKKLPGALFYANATTWEAIGDAVAQEKKQNFRTGEEFSIEDFTVRSFAIPHDAAEPVGFSVISDKRQVSIVTDAGYITEEIFREISEADLLLLEANHEEEILLMGSYPYHLKRRILGESGHLSNVSAGECLCDIMEERQKKRQILLGHLSRENNDPAVAILTVRNTLLSRNIVPGKDLFIDVAMRDRCSCIYEV